MEFLPEKIREPYKEEGTGSGAGKGRNWMKIDKGPAGTTNKTGSQETKQ